MIRIKLEITKPTPLDHFVGIYDTFFLLSEHKICEIEYYYFSDDLFVFNLDLRWRGADHIGPSIMVTLLGYTFSVRIVDNRHWDYNKGCWCREN